MQLTRLVMGLLILILITTPASAQFLSPTAQIQATIPLNTITINIGHTEIQGQVSGIQNNDLIYELPEDIPIEQLLQLQYNLSLDDLRLYPLLSDTTLPSISSLQRNLSI